MKAVHIVPDAFQRYTYGGGKENYPYPVTLGTPMCLFT